jgi:tetratricopeptide (TPR) repeat protein
VKGGYVSVLNRWMIDETVELLKKPDVIYGTTPELWSIRQYADTFYKGNKIDLILGHYGYDWNKYKDDPSLMMYIAFAYLKAGDTEKAIKHAERVCLADKGYCFGLADIGQSLIDSGRLSDSLKCFKRAYELYTDMNYRQMNLANALRKAGRYKEAIKYYEKYRLMNGSIPVCFLMGKTFLLMGDEMSALEHYKLAREQLQSHNYFYIENEEIGKAILEAVIFYEKNGFQKFADELKMSLKMQKLYDKHLMPPIKK